MTAALLRSVARPEPDLGLRPVQPRRDMAQLAGLLQIAFQGSLDRTSLRMVRDMKRFGQAGWIGWLLGRLFLPPAAYPLGFVWEQNGQVIGNASLMPVEDPHDRWVLANVAVHPDYRRRGIASRLVQASLGMVADHEGSQVVLQVDHDNPGAIQLYQHLGFQTLCTRAIWHRPADRVPVSSSRHSQVSRRSAGQWRAHLKLAQEVAPEGLIWPHRLEADWFRGGRLDGLRGSPGKRHWVYCEDPAVIGGALSALPNASNTEWHLALISAEKMVGRCEIPLLTSVLPQLASTGLAVTLEYVRGRVDDGLPELGFVHRRTMTWMGKEIAAP